MRPPLYKLFYSIAILLDIAILVISQHLGASYIIDLVHHVGWNKSSSAMTPIPGSNRHSTAYNLRGSDNRHFEVSRETVDRIRELLRDHDEFTISTVFKQHQKNVGSIISIRSHLYNSYLELESSGRRDELRVHYTEDSQSWSETFPYRLADNQWHRVALSFSRDYVEIFIDCNKIYERTIRTLDRNFTSDANLNIWLGQRNRNHGYFKGAIEYVQLVVRPQGILEQCPYANVACPTCGQFRQLEEAVTELQRHVKILNEKLEAAENRLAELEKCECVQSCDVSGTKYLDGQSWKQDACTTCTCQNGTVQCAEMQCPRLGCQHPVRLPGHCCPVCLKTCRDSSGVRYEHGESVCLTKSQSPQELRTHCECDDGTLRCRAFNTTNCPKLDCEWAQQAIASGECCPHCRVRDSCAQGHDCHHNANCISGGNRYFCRCKPGFQGDGKRCEDIDECAEEGTHRGHYCHSNTQCVNTIGSYQCNCPPGYIQEDKYSCREHDECSDTTHDCSPAATCINTPGSYRCQCQNGYEGDGHHCTAVCEEPCENDGQCVAPGTCACRQGFMGKNCEIDIDECELGIAQCQRNSVCINIPGSFYCQCRQGFYSDHLDNQFGALCADLNECLGWGGGHNCPRGTCQNTDGGYECRPTCRSRLECQGGCHHDGVIRQNGSKWKPSGDYCSMCQCLNGGVVCQNQACDCSKDNVDLSCCPHCSYKRKQCQHQEKTDVSLQHGKMWIYKCQQCQCEDGQVDCVRMKCPPLDCHHMVHNKGDCCPRCADLDPCHAEVPPGGFLELGRPRDQLQCYFGKTVYRAGQGWSLPMDPCTTCRCKGGHICCQYNQSCFAMPAQPYQPSLQVGLLSAEQALSLRAHGDTEWNTVPTNTPSHGERSDSKAERRRARKDKKRKRRGPKRDRRKMG